ncbi:acyl-protein thioesterase 1 [[Candida] anglica]|uniref:Acyl-protein thioesterase 1 n=1 Tax=[Candida] anglica TaxID=148631 RepID=A0ABP0EDI0_9ASCO
MSLPSAIRMTASSNPTGALIFFHGLGDSGSGWSFFPQLIKRANIVPNSDSINYVFPNAPEIPISVNGGYRMPGWFDIYEFGNPNAKQDVAGFLKSCELVKGYIKEQMTTYNIPAEKIIIGGFSQGAALTLATLALLDIKIGGAVIFSGFCPIKKELGGLLNKANFDTPVFQGHGTADPVIAHEFGQQTSVLFQDLGFKNFKFHSYPGLAHSASEEELEQAMEFIKNVLK